MRRTERTLGALDRFLSAADGRPDADDLQPFLVRQGREDGGEPLGHHALARAGRPGEQDVVSARGGDLQRALDRLLAHDVRKVERAVLRPRGRRGRGRGERAPSGQVREQRAEVGNGINGHTTGERSLGGIRLGYEYGFHPRVPRGERHGERAAHRAQHTGQRKLAEENGVLRRGVDLARSSEDGQQDREIVGRSGLFGVRRGEVHRHAGDRPVIRAGLGRGATRSPASLTAPVGRPTTSSRGRPPESRHSTVTR